MERIVLKNKPLLEAIFELRWELQEPVHGVKIDPHYKLLIGRIYDKVNDQYPHHEQLPTATMPDEIAEYVVQHRFRKAKDEWPLIQIGPGIITLNDTESYNWDDFEKRIIYLIDALFNIYPETEKLLVNRLQLRYIDGINFDYDKDEIFKFLKEKMKMNVDIHQELFENTGVIDLPLGFDLKFSFSSNKPKGVIHLRFARGKRKERDALIWETVIQSKNEDAPKNRDKIIDWAKEAHGLTSDWFFKIIKGDLLRSFE